MGASKNDMLLTLIPNSKMPQNSCTTYTIPNFLK